MIGKGFFRRGLSALLLIAGCLAQAAPVPDPTPTPQQWLERMAGASRELTFEGEIVYQQVSLLETLRVTHHVDDKGKERERILYLDGAPREMIRAGEELIYSNYGRADTRFQHGSLAPMLSKFAGLDLGKGYELKIIGIDRVAGREAVLMVVIPKDRFRYGYQLWLDRVSGLLLKSMMIDDNGKIMERMQFTNMKVGAPLPKESLAALEKKQESTDKIIPMEHTDIKQDVALGWETGWVPEGFSLKSRSRRPSPVSKQQVDALNFSDGIASFSVFVEADETRVLSQAAENIGALAAVSKVFRDGNNYYHVTVVGEVPLSTAERVAVSVRPVNNDS